MIANLPLLFANGNPTALSKISAEELERFITFMVTCSWGHDTAKDIRKPPWWPEDVSFSHPFIKPFNVPNDWAARLKSLVKKCYDYHKSAFLLVFSAQLARYPRKRLRYVDNRDHTTSLYYRPSGRLLVTFRNENLAYDQNKPIELDDDDDEPELKSTDIYLCDNCDSHFNNLDALAAHERLCNNQVQVSWNSCNGGLPEFLSALKLQPVGENNALTTSHRTEPYTRSIRSVANTDRGPPYPFSSLAYSRSLKSNLQRDNTYSRERIERYCCTSNIPLKTFNRKSKNNQFPIRYRRPIDYWHRKHVFPNQRNKEIMDLKAQLLLLKCKPISVNVERMSVESMEEYIVKLKMKAQIKAESLEDKDFVYVDKFESDLSEDVNMKTLDPLKKQDNDCEVIDLCSDDETSNNIEKYNPRAGVTCLMKGGAVLRRTAATPFALPAEPCGARQTPLPPAVLKPHPVVLITHTLNNLQTISLE